MARRPVHDRDQVQEAALNRDVGDIGAPDLIGPVDRHPLEQIGINPVRGMRRTGSRRLVDGLQAHQSHQPANPMTADANAFAPQLADHLTAAVKTDTSARISQVASIFSAARRRFCYKNHEVVACMERWIWHTRWVNRKGIIYESYIRRENPAKNQPSF